MLALVSAGGAQLDAGSVGLALARRWCDAGERVLFVEAATAGARLSQRLGEADRADYSPSARGLPSLMVARKPLTLRLLADHCYSLDTSNGSLWALFAPSHPAGARHAAAWLSARASDLAAVAVERRVVVASSLPPGGGPLAPLLQAAPVVAVLSAVESDRRATELRDLCRGAGLTGSASRYRVLVVEGDTPLEDERITAASGMLVAGRLPVVSDDRVLRLQGARRDRAFARRLDKLAGRLLTVVNLETPGAGPAPPTPPGFEQPGLEPEPAATGPVPPPSYGPSPAAARPTDAADSAARPVDSAARPSPAAARPSLPAARPSPAAARPADSARAEQAPERDAVPQADGTGMHFVDGGAPVSVGDETRGLRRRREV